MIIRIISILFLLMISNLSFAESIGKTSYFSYDDIPNSATTINIDKYNRYFDEPGITKNDVHRILGLASLAAGLLAGATYPKEYDPNILNSTHYKAAKASWQLGAAAMTTGLYAHWDDFHIRDGITDPDNVHIILGTLATFLYYNAVKNAVDNYNNTGYTNSDHANSGILGGVSMMIAIGWTW